MVSPVNSAYAQQVNSFLQPGRAEQQQQVTQTDDQRARRASAQQPQGEVAARTKTDQNATSRREAPFAGTAQDPAKSKSQGRGTVVDITV